MVDVIGHVVQAAQKIGLTVFRIRVLSIRAFSARPFSTVT